MILCIDQVLSNELLARIRQTLGEAVSATARKQRAGTHAR